MKQERKETRWCVAKPHYVNVVHRNRGETL